MLLELNVTHLINAWEDPESGQGAIDYSASVMEIGENAGAYTWQAAKEDADDCLTELTEWLRDDEKREAIYGWIDDFGAWDRDDSVFHDDDDLKALILQFIAGDYRKLAEPDGLPETEEEFEIATRNCGGDLFPSGTQWFYLLGN